MKFSVFLGIGAFCLLASGCIVGAYGDMTEDGVVWGIGIGLLIAGGGVAHLASPNRKKKRETDEEVEARLRRKVNESFERAVNALATQQPVDELHEQFRQDQAEWLEWRRTHPMHQKTANHRDS